MKQPLSLEDIIEYELAYIENPNALIFLENPELFRSKPHPHTTSPFNSSSTNLPCFDSIFDKEMDKNSRITKKVIKEEAIGYFSQEVSRTDWVDPKVLEIQFFLDENSIVDLLESPFNINKQGGHEGWVICSSGNDGRMCSQGQTKDIGGFPLVSVHKILSVQVPTRLRILVNIAPQMRVSFVQVFQ